MSTEKKKKPEQKHRKTYGCRDTDFCTHRNSIKAQNPKPQCINKQKSCKKKKIKNNNKKNSRPKHYEIKKFEK